MKKGLMVLMFTILSNLTSYSQDLTPTNLEYYVKDDQIIITYDLIADNSETYDCEVYLRREEYKAFKIRLTTVSGDVGEKIKAGVGKQIIWNHRYDYKLDPDVDDYYFELTIKVHSSGYPWYTYVAAAVLAGGIGVYFLISNGEKEEEKAVELVNPPSRPR